MRSAITVASLNVNNIWFSFNGDNSVHRGCRDTGRQWHVCATAFSSQDVSQSTNLCNPSSEYRKIALKYGFPFRSLQDML